MGAFHQTTIYCCIWVLVHFWLYCFFHPLFQSLFTMAQLPNGCSLLGVYYSPSYSIICSRSNCRNFIACSGKVSYYLFCYSFYLSASYKYFVRSTFIGMFLNGKVHKQKKYPETSSARSVNNPVSAVTN